MRFDSPRAGPLASQVLDGAWTAGNLGPHGTEIHGPPETDRALASCRKAVKPATPTNALEHTLLHKITG
ncbi:MAG TPA: hypothetical protein VM912_20130, partial [Terriglobales bacterium]|nr:hypothetical protein [Terriglobales bacterium]